MYVNTVLEESLSGFPLFPFFVLPKPKSCLFCHMEKTMQVKTLCNILSVCFGVFLNACYFFMPKGI